MLEVFEIIRKDMENYGITQQKFNLVFEYTKKLHEVDRVDHFNAWSYAAYFLNACDFMSDLYSASIRLFGELKAFRKAQGGIAYLETSAVYFQQAGQKPTDKAKESYKDRDKKHLDARSKESAAEALVTWFRNKMDRFENAHQQCKKLINEQNYQSPATQQALSQMNGPGVPTNA